MTDLPQYAFQTCTVITAIFIVLVIGFIFYTAAPVFEKEGLSFITGTVWSYEEHHYGIFYLIMGTLILTALTMIIAVPLGVCTAVFLAEWAPAWMEKTISPMIELLVGIPSVVYGLFGFYVLERFFAKYVDPTIGSTLGFIPIFRDVNPSDGFSILLGATILTIMVLPTIVALSQDALKAVPSSYREASMALGATKWETIKMVIIPAALSGIITAGILAMMRAIGETMAVVMVTGNQLHIPSSVLDTGYAMTSKILNDIGYHMALPEARSALFGIAAVIFLIEIILVALARTALSRHIMR